MSFTQSMCEFEAKARTLLIRKKERIWTNCERMQFVMWIVKAERRERH